MIYVLVTLQTFNLCFEQQNRISLFIEPAVLTPMLKKPWKNLLMFFAGLNSITITLKIVKPTFAT